MSAPPGPASKTRAQLRLLAMLVAVLAVVGWYFYYPTSPAPPTSQPQPAGPVRTAGPEDLPIPEPVALGNLEEPGEQGDAKRNPFAYGVRPPPPPPPRAAAPPPTAPANLPPPVPPGPPPINLRLIGLTQMPGGGRVLVTLKDPATSGVHHAFEGGVVDGRYRVVKVGLQSVVVSYLDGSGVRTIGLGG
jgi:hypothetical protein